MMATAPFQTLIQNNLGSRNVGPQGGRGIGQAGPQGVRGENGTQGSSGTGTGNLPVNDTVFVDVQFGNDATGERENAAAPYQTINGALSAALVGDVVYVRPGTYAESMVLRDGIDFYFELGAIVTPTGGYAFADTAAPVSVRIRGYVVVDVSHGGNSGGAVNLTRPTSFLDFQGIRATISAIGNTVGHTILHQAGRMKVDLVGLHNLSLAAGGTALTFNSGESIVSAQGITIDTIGLAAIRVEATTVDPLELVLKTQEFQANLGRAVLVGTLTSAIESHIDIRAQSMMGGQETIEVTDSASNGEINIGVDSFYGGVVNNAQVPAGNATLELNLVMTHFTGSNLGGLPAIRAIGGSTNFFFEQANTVNGPFMSTDPALMPAPFGLGLNGVIVTGIVGHLAPQGTGNVIDVVGSPNHAVNVALRFNLFDFDVEPPQYAVTVRDGGNLSIDAEVVTCRDPTLTLSNALSVDTSSLLECRIAQLSVPGQALFVANGSRATCSFQVLRRESSGAIIGPAVPMAEATAAGFMVFDAQEMVSVPQIAPNTPLIQVTSSIALPRIGYFHAPAAADSSTFVRVRNQGQMVGAYQVIVAEPGAGEPGLFDVATQCFISASCNLLVGGRAFSIADSSNGSLMVARITNGSGTGPSIDVTDGAQLDVQLGSLDSSGQAIRVLNSTKPGNDSQLNILFGTIFAGNDGNLPLAPAVSCEGLTGGRARLQMVGSEISSNFGSNTTLLGSGDSEIRANVNVLQGQNTTVRISDASVLHGRFGQVASQRSPAVLFETIQNCFLQCLDLIALNVSIEIVPQAVVLMRTSSLGNSGTHSLQTLNLFTGNGIEYGIVVDGLASIVANIDTLLANTPGTVGINLSDNANARIRLGEATTNDQPVLQCASTGNVYLQFQTLNTLEKIGCIYANAGQLFLDGARINANYSNSAITLEDSNPLVVFPNCTLRCETIQCYGDPIAPGPIVAMNSSGTLNMRFHTIFGNDGTNGGCTYGLLATGGNVSAEGVRIETRNNSNTGRGIGITGNASINAHVQQTYTDSVAVDLSTSNQAWCQIDEAQVLSTNDPVIRMTAPGPGQGTYTVGGYMRTPGTIDIDIVADVPNLVRLLGSVLVNDGVIGSFAIDSDNPVTVVCQQSIANTAVNAGFVTLAPVAALLVDPSVA